MEGGTGICISERKEELGKFIREIFLSTLLTIGPDANGVAVIFDYNDKFGSSSPEFR